MKILAKLIGLLLIGLFVSIIGYPFLHEMGHCVFAYCCGIEVSRVSLINGSFVDCKIDIQDKITIITVGVGGMLFPYLISIIYSYKNIWLWYLFFIMKLISLFSFVNSLLSAFLLKLGFSIQRDDTTIIMECYPQIFPFYIVSVGVFILFNVYLLIKRKPISKLLCALGV